MRRFITSVLVFAVAFLTFGATKASAAKIISNDQGTVTVAKGEVINDDLFVSAMTAEINGTVNGDVYIGAQTVRITGIVNGSLHAGGQAISIDGAIKGNVYAGAQDISLAGANIGGSVLLGSQNINIDKDSVIGGSVLAGASVIRIDSQVKRNVFAGAGMLTIGDNTKIGRDLFYGAGQNQASISEKAKITGTIHKSEVSTPKKVETSKELPRAITFAKVFASFGSFLGALLVGFLFLKFCGKCFARTAEIVANSFWKSFGVGFLITIAFVPGLIVLLITVIGVPVAGLAFLVFLIYAYMAKIVVGSAFGSWLARKFKWNMSTFWSFALGLLVIYILKFIPILGGLVGFVVFTVGLGALTLHSFSKTE